jgi:HPt (histidine-containing phosphotransfer) domain-containing protein
MIATKMYQNISLDYLDLMTEGDNEMRNTMLAMLLDELPAEIAKMRPLFEAKDWHELREVSHKMKSTLAFIGNDTMTEANKKLELIAKNPEGNEAIKGLILILEEHVPIVMEDLEDCLNNG